MKGDPPEIKMEASVNVSDFIIHTNHELSARINVKDGKIDDMVQVVQRAKPCGGVGMSRDDVIYCDTDELLAFCNAFVKAYGTAVGTCHRMKALKQADRPVIHEMDI